MRGLSEARPTACGTSLTLRAMQSPFNHPPTHGDHPGAACMRSRSRFQGASHQAFGGAGGFRSARSALVPLRVCSSSSRSGDSVTWGSCVAGGISFSIKKRPHNCARSAPCSRAASEMCFAMSSSAAPIRMGGTAPASAGCRARKNDVQPIATDRGPRPNHCRPPSSSPAPSARYSRAACPASRRSPQASA